MTGETRENTLGRIIAKALSNEAFKKRLLDDATAVFREEGLDAPDGLHIKALENTDKIVHIVLPAQNAPRQFDDLDLARVVGGAGGAKRCSIEPVRHLVCEYDVPYPD